MPPVNWTKEISWNNKGGQVVLLNCSVDQMGAYYSPSTIAHLVTLRSFITPSKHITPRRGLHCAGCSQQPAFLSPLGGKYPFSGKIEGLYANHVQIDPPTPSL